MRRSRCQSMVVVRVSQTDDRLPGAWRGKAGDGMARKECVQRVVSCFQHGTLTLARKRPTEAFQQAYFVAAACRLVGCCIYHPGQPSSRVPPQPATGGMKEEIPCFVVVEC